MINSLLHLFIRLCIKDFYLCRKRKNVTSNKEIIMNKIKKENLLYRKAIPCSRLFLRKEKTREQAKEVLMLSDSYKSEEDIERELDFIYSAPLEILEDEYKRKIHLFHKLGFVLSDSVPIS